MSEADGPSRRKGLPVLTAAVREEPWIFGAALAASALYGVAPVVTSWALGRITDRVILPAFESGETSYAALAAAGAAIFAVAMLRVVGVIGRRVGAGLMQFRLQSTYRRRVAHRYLQLPLSWHQRHPAGRLLSTVNSDVEAVWSPIIPLPTALGVVIMLVSAIGSLILVDPVLALVSVALFPAIGLLNVFYQRRLSPLAARAQSLRAEVADIAHESFDGAVVVKTLGLEAHEASRMAERAEALRDANVAVGRMRGRFDPLLDALPNLGILTVLAVGTVRMASGAIGVADLVQVAYLFTMIAFRCGPSAGCWAPGPVGVGFEEVEYAYPDGARVLHGVSAEIAPRSRVAMVGETGSGKSTFVKLLTRLADPSSGRVLLGGVPLTDVPLASLRRRVVMVPQDGFLFNTTVGENIRYGRPDVGDDEVRGALADLGLTGWVESLPHGLGTEAGPRGEALSAGERQLVALARAYLADPDLLVLDEATSAVDPATEQRLQRALETATRGRTATSVAHRLSTAEAADRVLVFDAGRIVQQGTHEELAARPGRYADLYAAWQSATEGDASRT
ncbi:ABC transporter ATP-binding protein [Streptomyces sp. 021-4]|uniref:ABC transporter ATP-binding protein n=1 Tax=Streptomyces sp. 021-4 TaxID=2789260 RepID=UPI0039F48BA2